MVNVICLFILIAVISSGSVLVCSLTERKYGEIVPLSCFGLILIELVLGVFFNLKVGFFAVMAVAVVCYIVAIIINVKNKAFRKNLRKIVTPGFVFLALCCGLFLYINHGKYFSNWDEFSHWGDVVRAMVALDDFGTNPESLCMFKSYPPAMSIFEYYLERIAWFIKPGKFNESLAYCAWQVLMVSFFLPFVEKVGEKSKISAILSGIAFLLSPLMVFSGVYYSTYIDPFLGIMAGIGFAVIFFIEEESLYKSLLLGAIAGILVISKESGLLFAAMVVFAYAIKLLVSKKYKELLLVGSPLLCLIIPKLLWEYELKASQVYKEFGGKVDTKELIQIIGGKVDNYRTIVWNKFFEWFATEGREWGRFGVSVSYFFMWIIALAIIIALSIVAVKANAHDKKSVVVSAIVMNATLAIFAVGTVISYMYKFSEYEAVRLASFFRYMNTVFLMLYVFMVCLAVYAVANLKKLKAVGALAVVLISIMLVPRYEINVELSGFAAEKSLWGIEDIHALADYTNEVCNGKGNICFIAQEDNGFYKLVYTSLVKPNKVYPYWSIGEAFYEDDVYTQEISCSEWKEMLLKEYDYVELYKLNDYFYENYSDAFLNPEEIGEGCFFKVNKETGLLEKVF